MEADANKHQVVWAKRKETYRQPVKEPWPKPAYNIQTGTERVRQGLKRLPKKIVADAACGSEENYAYVEGHKLENYLKCNTFYQDTDHHRKAETIRQHQFRAEHFGCDVAWLYQSLQDR